MQRLALLSIILIVIASIHTAYGQPDLWTDRIKGGSIREEFAIFKLGVTNVGNSTATEIKINFVSVDDTLVFTPKISNLIPDILEPKDRIDLVYEVTGSEIGFHEYYLMLEWEDQEGNKYNKGPLYEDGYQVYTVIKPKTVNYSTIIIGIGAAIVIASIGYVLIKKKKSK